MPAVPGSRHWRKNPDIKENCWDLKVTPAVTEIAPPTWELMTLRIIDPDGDKGRIIYTLIPK